MTVSVLCTLYVLSMVALLNARWLKYLWSILSWNRDCSDSQLRWKWWWLWWLLFCTITSTLAASSGCCRQSKLWAKWEETAALCPETEKGPLQTEDLSPRVRSRCTLREGSSCRAGCLCAPSIGKLSQLSSFTPSSNRGNMAATSHSQLFTIFFSVLKVERDRRNQWKAHFGYFSQLSSLHLSHWLADTSIGSHRNRCGKYWGNSQGGEEIGTKLLLFLLSVFIYFGPTGLDRN